MCQQKTDFKNAQPYLSKWQVIKPVLSVSLSVGNSTKTKADEFVIERLSTKRWLEASEKKPCLTFWVLKLAKYQTRQGGHTNISRQMIEMKLDIYLFQVKEVYAIIIIWCKRLT